jgi:serine/threonine protein kinase
MSTLNETASFDALDEQVREELAPDLRVIRLLGRGSVASVYLAREAALDRPVAVKVLSPGPSRDEKVRRRFEREARSAAKISHANVTSVYQVGRLSTGVPYFVMEYVEGRNLEDGLRAGGPMSEEDARATLAGIAAALAAAHAKEIIHRDVKPANVLRDNDTGRIVLTDFGVAAVRDTGHEDTSTRLTVQGEVLGDMRYVSPEHLQGEPLTELADVYSLGMLGYELLTLTSPYEASSNAELAAAHLRQTPTPLETLRPGTDPALANLLGRCLAKRPEHRPAAAEVARLLLAETDETPQSPPTTALGAFLAELKRRHVYKVAVAYAAATFIAVEGVQNLTEPFDLPSWINPAVVITVLAGFPVAIILAWVFDIRAGAITRTQALADESAGGGLRQRRLVQLVGLALILALVALYGWVRLR